jgi:uncharacterized protein
MVSFNVSQLLLMGPGEVREFEFSETLTDPDRDLPLRGPVTGYTRLTRTSEGILAHTEYRAELTLECARCLEEADIEVEGDFDEEFLPSTDIRTGMALELHVPDDQPLIDEHHEIVLDELLRQNILTNLPLRPLCESAYAPRAASDSRLSTAPTPNSKTKTSQKHQSIRRAPSLGWRSCCATTRRGKPEHGCTTQEEDQLIAARTAAQPRPHQTTAADELPAVQAA